MIVCEAKKEAGSFGANMADRAMLKNENGPTERHAHGMENKNVHIRIWREETRAK